MVRASFYFPALLLLIGAAPSTAPSTAPTVEQTLAERKLAEQKEYSQKVADLPPLPQRQIKDLFRFTIENGELILRPKIGKTDRSRAEIKGLQGPAVIAIGGDQPGMPDGATFLQFELTDFSHADEVFRHTQLFASAASMQLSCDAEAVAGSRSVSLITSYGTDEPEQATRLYVQLFAPISDDLQTKLNLSAPNFVELRRLYPREVRQYVDPILRDLQQTAAILAPDPRVAYQVFATDLKPDAALMEKINAALSKFDNENFKVRRSAGDALRELGEPAALALLRVDRTGWSVDRSNGVDAFLAQFDSQPSAEISKLVSDPSFLLDCLYSEDVATRVAATAQLEKILGKPIRLNANADLAARVRAIDALYPILLPPTTRPSTQP